MLGGALGRPSLPGRRRLRAAVLGTEGFFAGVAVAASSGDRRLGCWVVACLGERTAVERVVELPVACPAEPMTFCVAGPDRQWGCAVVVGERMHGVEASDPCHFAHELRGRERCDSGNLAGYGRARLGPLVELVGKRVDLNREGPDQFDQPEGDPGDDAVVAVQPFSRSSARSKFLKAESPRALGSQPGSIS